MKKVMLLLSVCMLFSLWGFSLKITPENVPASVKEAFAKKFPAATNITYAMEKSDYEVTFKDKEVGMSANFNSKGEWLETETIMIESDLPKDVLTSAATNYVGFVTTNITKVEGRTNAVNY